MQPKKCKGRPAQLAQTDAGVWDKTPPISVGTDKYLEALGRVYGLRPLASDPDKKSDC